MTMKELASAQAKTQEILQEVTDSLKTLAGTVESLAGSVVAHDNQIEALIQISEKNHRDWQDLQRQWQAYIKTLPRH